MRNELVPHIYVIIEHQKEYFNCRGTPPQEEQRALAPYRALQPSVPVPGRGVPTKSGCENQQGFWPTK